MSDEERNVPDDNPPPQYGGHTPYEIAAPGRHYGPDDFYHRNVQNAARKMVRLGYGHTHTYVGQWASGKTVWRSKADESKTIGIEREVEA